MYILGMDDIGGSTTARKANTSWDDWFKLVQAEMSEYVRTHLDDYVLAEYRKCYERGISVHEALIEMY